MSQIDDASRVALSPLPREISVNRATLCVDLCSDANHEFDLARVMAHSCALMQPNKDTVMAAKKKAKKKAKKAGKKKARKAASRR